VAAVVEGPGVLTLRDGRRIEGDITEGAESVTVNMNGIVTTVPRTQVLSIEYGTPEERLERRLSAVEPGDEAGRMDIADEALRRGLLDFAQKVADQVEQADPGNPRAQAMLDQIERQRQLDLSRGQGVRPRSEGGSPGGRALRPTTRNVLSEDQINRIRQVELRTADATASRERPRVSFQDGVVKRFVDSRPNLEFRDFNRRNDVDKALFMLRESRDESILEDIRITSHPTGVLEYLRRVEPVVLNGCATSDCHGGDAAASFALYNPARDDATSYTNFYLLSTGGAPVVREGGGAFGAEDEQAAAVGRLIDRGRPEDSLLLTFMLPRGRTDYPHPEVEGYNGMVLSVDEENYRIIREWIARSLPLLPADGYGFDFELDLPGASPATRPSTQPTTQPAAAQP
jgi:hypothetical protein